MQSLQEHYLSVLDLKLPIHQYLPQDIKVAYRRMVRRKHPDTGGSSESFIELQQAYQYIMHHLGNNVSVPPSPPSDISSVRRMSPMFEPEQCHWIDIEYPLTLHDCWTGGDHFIRITDQHAMAHMICITIPACHHPDHVIEYKHSEQKLFVRIKIRLVPHPELQLDAETSCLIHHVTINWAEAMFGFRRTLPVTGEVVGTPPGMICTNGAYRVAHHGWRLVHSPHERGDLILHVQVEMPSKTPKYKWEWGPWIQQWLPSTDNTDLLPDQLLMTM